MERTKLGKQYAEIVSFDRNLNSNESVSSLCRKAGNKLSI